TRAEPRVALDAGRERTTDWTPRDIAPPVPSFFVERREDPGRPVVAAAEWDGAAAARVHVWQSEPSPQPKLNWPTFEERPRRRGDVAHEQQIRPPDRHGHSAGFPALPPTRRETPRAGLGETGNDPDPWPDLPSGGPGSDLIAGFASMLEERARLEELKRDQT